MAKNAKSSLDVAAEKIGSTLGHLAAQVAGLDKQRQALADQVRTAIAQGQALLENLTGADAPESGDDTGAPAAKPAKGKAKRARKTAPADPATVPPSVARKNTKTTARERTKPGDVRAAVRASAHRNWTNRQQGRG
jgi:hypothetical protein